jgi:hypothetical protein
MRWREFIAKLRSGWAGWKWPFGWKWPTAGAILVVSFFLVRYLVGDTGLNESAQTSVEESWNARISSLRVIPIFPPEEDIAVGDIFATVIADDDPDSSIPESDRKVRRSFIGRSVKLAHVPGVINELEKAYEPIPVFPSSGEVRDRVIRKFKDGVSQSNLPRAAFPRLKIEGIDTAGAGILAGNSGGVSYSASKKQYAEFELSDVRTYGFPIVLAGDLLKKYCTETTNDVCIDRTARKHLKRIIGERTLIEKEGRAAPRTWWMDECFTNKQGDYEYSLKVEIAMVYRVYLTNSIRDLRRSGRSQMSWLRAIWPFGDSNNKSTSDLPAPQAPGTAPTGGDDQIAGLKKKLAEIENELARIRNGGALSYESSFGSESSLEGKFERPIAIAYRSVPFEFEPVQCER